MSDDCTFEPCITGQTAAELMQQTTFVGWSFGSVWLIEEGVSMPRLVGGAQWP